MHVGKLEFHAFLTISDFVHVYVGELGSFTHVRRRMRDLEFVGSSGAFTCVRKRARDLSQAHLHELRSLGN